ncbi:MULTISPECIES: hypothetical protein [Halolamina]|uniref:Uncharacterized protein n=1 Tax=Halolamina pelagica TaxID=699431 RepID=A0A1I5QPL2_9EURY|nr:MULTISPECIES: hypothetical protein [Halolamina]NHX35477.1 hypothetical protein [Halolamina sp. R1-12]SFP48040.1 hypothetical protein SAMN05216277_10420 [Halolamina pelagica]
MHWSRRAVLASLPVALAGCGRSFRENTVPGGLHLRNRRAESVTVSVRAAVVPDHETGDATASPATPKDRTLDDPEVTEEYRVQARGERAVADFFPSPGRWAFEAVVDADGDRSRIELHAALPGPTGADTMLVTVRERGVTARATTADD